MGLEPTNLLTASYFPPTFPHCLELRQSGKCQVKLYLSAELASIDFPLLPRTGGDDVGKMWGRTAPRYKPSLPGSHDARTYSLTTTAQAATEEMRRTKRTFLRCPCCA